MTILEELGHIARTSPERLKQQKKEGIKIIGYTGRFVPEELIYASGAVPYLLCRGGDPEPPDAVLPYMLRFMSPLARAQCGYYLLNLDPIIPMLDLIIAQCNDCHMSRLADLFEYFKLPVKRIGVPPDWEKPISRDYYRRGLGQIKQSLENVTGNKISEQQIKQAINDVNGVRVALKNISLLRKKSPPPIGGYDFIRLNHYSFACPLDDVVTKLGKLYNELKNNGSHFTAAAPRILLAGHAVAIGDYVIPKLVEDSGGVIVAEFLDEGIHHYMWSAENSGDGISDLVETYYVKRTPPSIFQPSWAARAEYVKSLIQDFHVDGVIWYQLSFEEIYDMECPIISRAVEEMNIPFLKLESSYEYSREAMGPLVTRIESFIESIRGKGR